MSASEKEISLLTLDEAAKRTGYSHDYLRSLIKEGKISAQKIGSKWMVGEHTLLLHQTRNRGGRKNKIFTPQYVRQHFDRLYLKLPTVLFAFLPLLFVLSVRASPYVNNAVYTYFTPGSSATMQLVVLGHEATKPLLSSAQYFTHEASLHQESILTTYAAELLRSFSAIQEGVAEALLFTSSLLTRSADVYISGGVDFAQASSHVVLVFGEQMHLVASYVQEGVSESFAKLASATLLSSQVGQEAAREFLISAEDMFTVTGKIAYSGAGVGNRFAQVIIDSPRLGLSAVRALARSK